MRGNVINISSSWNGAGRKGHQGALKAAVLLSLWATPSVVAEVHETVGWRLTGIPLVNFSSDDGTGYGLRLNLFEYDGGTIPYRRKLSAQAFFTTKGKWVHRLLLDSPAFRGRNERLQVEIVYEKEDLANYYGGLSGSETAGLSRDQTTFQQAYPEIALTWILPLRNTWHLRLGGQLNRRDVSPNASTGSILADRSPLGVDGGTLLQVNGALRYDSRDNYNDSSSGVLEELLVEYGVGAGGDFNGVTARFQHRHFRMLTGSLTVAHRLEADWTAGDLPFYEELELGGSTTVRGLPGSRHRGQARVLLNGELRWLGVELSSRQNMRIGLLAFVDVGQIFGRDQLPAAGEWSRGAGGGLRYHWHSTIVRADYGVSSGDTGIYITFSQLF